MFITQTELGRSKETQAKIRKHVMKDIGKARRKVGRKEKILQFTLELPEKLENLEDSRAIATPKTVERPDSHATSRISHAIGALLPVPVDVETEFLAHQQSVGRQAGPISTIERVWTGRMDPFMKYPIEMNSRTLQLIDHGESRLLDFLVGTKFDFGASLR